MCISAVMRLKQKDLEFDASLGYIERLQTSKQTTPQTKSNQTTTTTEQTHKPKPKHHCYHCYKPKQANRQMRSVHKGVMAIANAYLTVEF